MTQQTHSHLHWHHGPEENNCNCILANFRLHSATHFTSQPYHFFVGQQPLQNGCRICGTPASLV